jgi:putative copper export protein
MEDAAILLGSPWGTRWIAALALSALVLAAFSVRRLRPMSRVLPFALAAYPALSGHAAGTESWTAAAVAADWLHVVAAGLWIGALWVLLLGGRGEEAPTAPLVRHLHRFSVLARVGVASLVLTGAAASWLHLPGVSALWTHPYGRILALKLALVAGLLMLGAWNWRVLSPTADTPRGASRLLAAARLEGVLGVVVLAVTGWLTGTAPPP